MLAVNEIFETIQGEATYTGTPSVFVRLQFCDVGCGWCDTKHTWELKGPVIPMVDVIAKLADSPAYGECTDERLIAILQRFKARHIVFTGGEPCFYDLTAITTKLGKLGYTTQVETSGTYPIRVSPETWITVSPKFNMSGGKPVLTECLKIANEIKMPVGKQADIDQITDHVKPFTSAPIWLQPLSESKKATALCVAACLDKGYKLSVQTHKVIGVR